MKNGDNDYYLVCVCVSNVHVFSTELSNATNYCNMTPQQKKKKTVSLKIRQVITPGEGNKIAQSTVIID
jgi:hypothetical protein